MQLYCNAIWNRKCTLRHLQGRASCHKILEGKSLNNIQLETSNIGARERDSHIGAASQIGAPQEGIPYITSQSLTTS